MKFMQVITASILAFCVMPVAYASNTPKSAPPTNAVQEGGPQKPSGKNTANMKECGRGYVVGVWMGADGWDDWGVWLSATGQSYSNTDVKFYRAYSYAESNQDPGKTYYAAVLNAMATGALVLVQDDAPIPRDSPDPRCQSMGTGDATGAQFDSIEIWYP